MKKSKTTKWLMRGGLGLAFVVFFIILYSLSALSGLRFFIPHYLTIAGTPFESKSYLVVLQNNNELRPSGGRIMAAGSITFKNGLFSDIEISNFEELANLSKNIDTPYPTQDNYSFFDANYDPDFTLAANNLIATYKTVNPNSRFDGVIALNVTVLKDILNIIGSIYVNEERINSKNIFEKIENSDGQTLREIGKAIISKSFCSILSWRNLSDMFVKNFNEKQIQLYVFDKNLQNKLDEKKWSGAWPKNFEGDFLATVEANLGQNQINKYINRALNYRLYLCNPKINKYCSYEGKIAYTIENVDRSPEAKNYKGYIRFYFPKNTNLKSANTNITHEDNQNYTVIGTLVNLNPGERKTIEMMVELPEVIFNQEVYNLYIPKQSGTVGDSYSIIIETPNSSKIESKSFNVHDNIASWQGALLRDKILNLSVTESF